MPSLAHETLADLFKNRPSLGAELLSEALGIALPAYTEARAVSLDSRQGRPTARRSDVAILLLDGGAAVSVLIVDVQRSVDPRKRFSWLDDVTRARAAHGCPASLLVVALDPAVAAWCAEPIETGIPGFVLRPPVLGSADVPVVTDPAAAALRPELAVLSAVAHGASEAGAAIAAAVLPALRAIDDEKARVYGDLVLSALDEPTQRALEAMTGDTWQRALAKKYVTREQAELHAQGIIDGWSTSLMIVLEARGIAVPEATRELIAAQKAVMQLERWLVKAVTATSLDDVFGEPS